MENKLKRSDHIDLIRKEYQRALFSFIPGSTIIDSVVNYRDNLKNKRILDFSESIKSVLEEIGQRELHAENFTTETFVDLMEMVFQKVAFTNSIAKLEKFRNIIVNQILEPTSEDYLFKKYITILDQLNEVQLLILLDFKDWKDTPIRNIIIAYEGDRGSDLKADHIVQRITQRVGREVTKGEIEYYTNELTNMGLVYNSAKVITAMGASSPQNNFQISSVGLSFLEYIELNTEAH